MNNEWKLIHHLGGGEIVASDVVHLCPLPASQVRQEIKRDGDSFVCQDCGTRAKIDYSVFYGKSVPAI